MSDVVTELSQLKAASAVTLLAWENWTPFFAYFVLSSVLRVPVVALLGLHLGELAMSAVVQFHHAHVALPGWLDRGRRAVIVTPFMHKVHHSRWQPETDSNYATLFSFWDWRPSSWLVRSRCGW